MPPPPIWGLISASVGVMLHHSKLLSLGARAMELDELNGRYQHLRTELDAAYAEPVWDSSRINRIAEDLIPVELALASFEHQHPGHEGASHV